MARAADMSGVYIYANSGAVWGLADAWSVSDYARTGVAWCYDQGIMGGIASSSGTMLSPQGSCTRAQFAKMVMVLTRDVL